MAMTASSMASKIATAFNALGIADPSPSQTVILEALCQGIIDEIQQNAVATTKVTGGSSAGTYTGTVE